MPSLFMWGFKNGIQKKIFLLTINHSWNHVRNKKTKFQMFNGYWVQTNRWAKYVNRKNQIVSVLQFLNSYIFANWKLWVWNCIFRKLLMHFADYRKHNHLTFNILINQICIKKWIQCLIFIPDKENEICHTQGRQ